MKRTELAILVFLCAVSVSCGGYHGQSDPLSPEEVQISDMATALRDDAASLLQSAPATLKDLSGAFSDAAVRFQNICLRMGANSLESRRAFDQVMFQEAQITNSPELEKNPEFNTRWQDLRKTRLNELATKLGYRPEKFQE